MQYITGIATVVIVFTRWGWAKLRGRDYSAGENTDAE